MLDVEFCRSQFPPLRRELVYLENAGGSYVPQQVIDRMNDYMNDTQLQPCWSFAESKLADDRISRGTQAMAELINADVDEIVVGPSTTLNVYVLAQALRAIWSDGDEIIVTNQDHEANGGAWRRLAERGITVREWKMDPVTGDLSLDELDELLGSKTRLVCCPHVSNIVGSVNDVAEITARAHRAGALVCVDGVATVAHTLPDVKEIGCDFYLFSAYKLYGPHLAVLYARREHIEAAGNQNHFFHENNIPGKLNPGGTNYESAAALEGVQQYIDAVHGRHFESHGGGFSERARDVYRLFRDQEAALMAPFVEYVSGRSDIRLIGRATSDPASRAPTFSFVVEGRSSEAIANMLGEQGFAVGWGSFYADRCVEGLGIDPADGVIRVSMTHYNTVDEVQRFIQTLDRII